MAIARATLRRQLRARRRGLSDEQQHRAAVGLRRVAMGSGVLRRRRRIAFYLPGDGEIDVLPLLARIHAIGRHCYLPVLDTMESGRLWFMRWQPGDRLVRNRFGIGEPARGERVHASALDLILLPLVAFDGEGNRLGMGSGYYDRTLAFLRHRDHWRRPVLYGVAHEFQRVAALDAAPWDVPLDGCLTECRLHLFRPRHRSPR